MSVQVDSSLKGIDWVQAKADLAADEFVLEQVPGQHVGLQTDDRQDFYASLGFKPQPEFWSIVVGSWLDNAANRDA